MFVALSKLIIAFFRKMFTGSINISKDYIETDIYIYIYIYIYTYIVYILFFAT